MKTNLNPLFEFELDPTTKWTHNGQYNLISKILDKYPTPQDFKQAVVSTGNKKAIKLLNNLSDTASKNDYIDFLQTVFIKYSNTGKFLLSLGIGTAIGLTYKHFADKISNENESNVKNTAMDSIKKSRKEIGDKILGDGTKECRSSDWHDLQRLKKDYGEDFLDNSKHATAADNWKFKTYGHQGAYKELDTTVPHNMIYDLQNTKSNTIMNTIGSVSSGGLGAAAVSGLGRIFDKKRVDDLKK